jgi:hypothetical protein
MTHAFDPYAAKIDAGSTHSAIYVYKWPHRESSTFSTLPPFSVVQLGGSSGNHAPISSFAANPSQAGPSLRVRFFCFETSFSPSHDDLILGPD